MSHELRTPLNAIIGFSELIAHRSLGELDERYVAYARDIHQSGRHLLHVVTDILDLTSLEMGSRRMASDPFSCSGMIENAIEDLRSIMADRSIAVQFSHAQPEMTALGDEKELKRAFDKILSNAVNFSPIGETIDIALTREVSGEAMIEVTDRGPGIPQQAIDQILYPLEIGEATIARPYGGTGLGLAIVKKIVELHGGQLSLRSVEGSGCTVVIVLPPERLFMP